MVEWSCQLHLRLFVAQPHYTAYISDLQRDIDILVHSGAKRRRKEKEGRGRSEKIGELVS